MGNDAAIEVGIIGGVGQQLDLEDVEEVRVPTPYGDTSAPLRIGRLGSRRVAVIRRRGVGDALQAHLVPYRANAWALASLGAKVLITTTAAGGLRESFAPGIFVVCDQLIDRTYGRPLTFYDEGRAIQLSAPEPFDPTLRGLAGESLAAQQVRFRDFGTAVVINGPRFSTRAEARWHAQAGADLVTTTLMPETSLAAELGLAVVNVSLITDDIGGGADYGDVASVDLVGQRIKRGRTVLVRTVSDIARGVPRGFRPPSSIPADAIAEVLARPVR